MRYIMVILGIMFISAGLQAKEAVKVEKAMFGAGCFWHVQEAFSEVEGVKATSAGYSGGKTPDPSYKRVCAGDTGHAEVVYVEYDPEEVDYEELLEVFWDIHDPTQLKRQGWDVGEQYRSVIFYYTDSQKKKAEMSLKKEQEKYKKKIVTDIRPAKEFYEAEEYHQDYNKKRRLFR